MPAYQITIHSHSSHEFIRGLSTMHSVKVVKNRLALYKQPHFTPNTSIMYHAKINKSA